MHANVTVLTTLHPRRCTACIYATIRREVLSTFEAAAVAKTFLSGRYCLIRQCCFQQFCPIVVLFKSQALPVTCVR